jgi:hypothetical protein
MKGRKTPLAKGEQEAEETDDEGMQTIIQNFTDVPESEKRLDSFNLVSCTSLLREYNS